MSLKKNKKIKKNKIKEQAWVWPSQIESWNVGLYLREENTSDTLSVTIHADPHLICNNRYLPPLSCFPYIRSSTLHLSRYLFYHLHISKHMLSLSLSLSLSLCYEKIEETEEFCFDSVCFYRPKFDICLRYSRNDPIWQ